MKKKIILGILACFMTVYFTQPLAAEEDFSDTQYWESYCDSTSEDYHDDDTLQVERCKLYRQHKLGKSNALIQRLEKEAKEIQENLEEARKNANAYHEEAKKYEPDIRSLQEKVRELNQQISKLTEDVEKNRSLVEDLNERVIERMRNAQKTMHFNPFLDFLLGSHDLADLNRRSYGIQAVMSKDNEDRTKLIKIIEKLKSDEAKLQKSKQEVEKKKNDLENKQAELSKMEEYYQQVAKEYQKKIDANRNEQESARKSYAEIAEQLDLSTVPSSSGLISPARGASINAGTWYYPGSFGGGVHLGVDYGLSIGSDLVAPANGVVIVSSDGCGYGYLGDSCSGDGNGVAYGGNQVYIMVAAGGKIYVISYSHLLKGSPIQLGTIVQQGDYVGKVGSSGNSTGAHCHIELFYLGEGDMDDLQNDYLHRHYSQSFNCGWGVAALDRLCENGVGAPCRLKPENYLGS